MTDPAWLSAALTNWRQRGLERCLMPPPSAASDHVLNFADNDYLNLSRHPDLIAAAAAALAADGTGARASRVMAGNLDCHRNLEKRLAERKGFPDALLFGSGFLANLGVLSALVGRGDTILMDRLAHASLVDGARLSGARLVRFRHNDPDHLDALMHDLPPGRRRLIVTESVFSMDGDTAPIDAIAGIARAGDALLLIDEAHATGVFGDRGAGRLLPSQFADQAVIAVGTLSKALGAYGGFVTCTETMRTYLIQRARSFTYSTALPAAVIGAALAALDICGREPSPGRELLSRAARFRERLQRGGADTGHSQSQIVPVMLGDNQRALQVADALRRQQVFCLAIRPPTVPSGSARIRFSISLRHSVHDLERVAEITLNVLEKELSSGDNDHDNQSNRTAGMGSH